MKIHYCIFATLLLGAASFAEEKPVEKPAEPAKAAQAPAEVKTYAPTDLTALKEVKGQKIILEGKIAASGANRTESIRYLNFTQNFRESASLVFFANAGGGTFTKEKLGEYIGKKVRVSGTLAEYNGSLQIRMESLDQIKVIEEPAAPVPTTPPAK
jgi:hypothetical protein